MRKTIDLEKDYNIFVGSFGMPPYANKKYHDAKHNLTQIQLAIDEAYEEGYDEVEFNKVRVTLPYSLHSTVKSASSGDELVHLRSDTKYYWNHSVLEMMFDSNNVSPFHTWTDNGWSLPYELRGKVVTFRNTKNTELHQLEIMGDVYKRSWVKNSSGKHGRGSEASQEQTYGIAQGERAFNVKVIDCKVHGFVGDAITGEASVGQHSEGSLLVATRFHVFEKGEYDASLGEINKAINGTYISDIKVIDQEVLNNPFNLNNSTVSMRSTAATMLPSGRFTFIWFDENEDYISETTIHNKNHFEVPAGSAKVRMQIYNIEGEEETWTFPRNYSWAPYITVVLRRGFILDSCEIYNNHRGGLSNLGDHYTIQNCWFRNNGLDCGIGAPLFPDTTRFQVDIEESGTNGNVIKDNIFDGSLNGLLISGDNVVISGNTLTNTGGITFYARTFNALVTGNTIHDGWVGFHHSIPRSYPHRRRVRVIGNYISSSSGIRCTASQMGGTDLIVEGNHFVGGISLNGSVNEIVAEEEKTTDGTINFSNNHVTMMNTDKSEWSMSTISNVDVFEGNIIERDMAVSYRGTFILQGALKGSNIIRNMPITKVVGSFGRAYPHSDFRGFHFDNCSYIYQLHNYDVREEYTDCIFTNTKPELINATKSEIPKKTSLRFERCTFKHDEDVTSLIGGTWHTLKGKSENITEVTFIDCKVEAEQATDLFLVSAGSNIQDSKIKVTVKNLYAPKWNGEKVLKHGNLLE